MQKDFLLNEKIILEIYKDYNKVYGPYIRKDGRKIVGLYDTKSRIKTTRQYSKVKLEVYLKRKLVGDETVDHIDQNSSNDHIQNLRVLSRKENARRSSIGNQYSLGFKHTEEHKRTGSKNGKAKLNEEKVAFYRNSLQKGLMSKKEIIAETKLNRRTVENFLNYITYKN